MADEFPVTLANTKGINFNGTEVSGTVVELFRNAIRVSTRGAGSLWIYPNELDEVSDALLSARERLKVKP